MVEVGGLGSKLQAGWASGVRPECRARGASTQLRVQVLTPKSQAEGKLPVASRTYFREREFS